MPIHLAEVRRSSLERSIIAGGGVKIQEDDHTNSEHMSGLQENCFAGKDGWHSLKEERRGIGQLKK